MKEAAWHWCPSAPRAGSQFHQLKFKLVLARCVGCYHGVTFSNHHPDTTPLKVGVSQRQGVKLST